MKKGARKRKRKKTGKQASKRERYGLIFLAFYPFTFVGADPMEPERYEIRG
jgi:hypothetical protein